MLNKHFPVSVKPTLLSLKQIHVYMWMMKQ